MKDSFKEVVLENFGELIFPETDNSVLGNYKQKKDEIVTLHKEKSKKNSE